MPNQNFFMKLLFQIFSAYFAVFPLVAKEPANLPSLFQVIQETGNEQLAPLLKQHLNSGRPLENPDLLRDLIQRLESGQIIEGKLSSTHYGIERANFTKQELEVALAAQSNSSS